MLKARLLGFSLALCSFSACSAADLALETALSHLAENLSTINTSKIEVKSNRKYTDTALGKVTYQDIGHSVSFRDGPKFRLRIEQSQPSADVGTAVKLDVTHHINLLVDGNTVTQYHESPLKNEQIVSQNSDKGAAAAVFALSDPDSILCGYLWGDLERIDSLLKGCSSVKITGHESINGDDCVMVEASGDQEGKCKLWLDTSKDFTLVQASVEKVGNNLLYGVPISKATPPGPKRPNEPHGTKYTFSMRNVETKQINASVVASGCDWNYTLDFSDGQRQASEGHINRVTIELHPDFAKDNAFGLGIPEGSRAFLSGESSVIPKVWKDGKVVNDVDAIELQELNKRIPSSNDGTP